VDDDTLHQLLEPLYESMLDPDRLDEFNLRLGQAVGSHITGVLGHDVLNARASVSRLHGADVAQIATGMQSLDLSQDPWVSRAVPHLATGRVFNTEELLPNTQMRRTDTYHSHYARFGVEQQVVAVGHFDGSNSVTLSICRDDRARLFDARELRLFERLVPHWVNAYAVMRRLDLLQARVESLEAALDQTPVAMFALAADLRLLRTNDAGEQLLAQGTLSREQGRLCVHGARDTALQQLLSRTVQAGIGARGGDVERLLLQASGGRLALTAHPLPASLAPGEARVLVFVQPLAPQTAGTLERTLGQLFGLTGAEARLANALLRHADLAEAAQACGIALSTAQTRLKLVFDKTGERSQPALVRLLSALHALGS
jgi:DNA-binding CsgD family transcriptional regulator